MSKIFKKLAWLNLSAKFLKSETKAKISIDIGPGCSVHCGCSRLVSVGSVKQAERFDSRYEVQAVSLQVVQNPSLYYKEL